MGNTPLQDPPLGGNENQRSKIGVLWRGKEVENYALDECRILGSGLAALGLSLADTDLCFG